MLSLSSFALVGKSVTTCAQGGPDCKAVRRGVREAVVERRLRKVQTECYRLNRVFYKELEEGACKIVDGNMILLA
jgi:hypothetical protein